MCLYRFGALKCPHPGDFVVPASSAGSTLEIQPKMNDVSHSPAAASLDEKKYIDDNANSLDIANGSSFSPLSEAEDRKLTRKLDLKLVPILGLLYLICFLDRTNIANARIQGLEKGLNMPAKGFNTVLWIFYIPFVLAEVPSNMIMALPSVRPHLWLGTGTFLLGTLNLAASFDLFEE